MRREEAPRGRLEATAGALVNRAVARAQKRAVGLEARAWSWEERSEETGAVELHKRGNRKLRRAIAKLERVERAAK